MWMHQKLLEHLSRKRLEKCHTFLYACDKPQWPFPTTRERLVEVSDYYKIRTRKK